VLALALGASLVLAWQPLDPAARRVQWQRRHARPDALTPEPAAAAPSRVQVVRSFRLGAPAVACLDCAHVPTLEALPAAVAPEALRLVPHVSAGTSWSQRGPTAALGSARCARPGRGR
jgi:hypothetical protein